MQVAAALTSSAEVDGSTYGSGALQGAGAQALPHVQVTHLQVSSNRITQAALNY